MPMDSLVIPVFFYFDKMVILVLQGLFVSGSKSLSSSPRSRFPQTRSPHLKHALQELKDDLLDDTT